LDSGSGFASRAVTERVRRDDLIRSEMAAAGGSREESAVTELERAVRLANARCAAWRTHGVPLEGEFRASRGGAVAFSPRCTACEGGHREGNAIEPAGAAVPAGVLLLALWYRGVSRWVLGGCAHFGVLLGPEPPEVTALIPVLFLEDPGLGGEP
jgi:hypothetical protein